MLLSLTAGRDLTADCLSLRSIKTGAGISQDKQHEYRDSFLKKLLRVMENITISQLCVNKFVS